MSSSQATGIKIAYIGGGSRYWAHELMSDLALCPEIKGHLALYDINLDAALTNVKIAQDIFSRPESKTKFTVSAEKKAEGALKGADFVVCSIEPGPTEMRYSDLEIPAKYGIVQPVGDSSGPGGIMRALRSVPVKMDYARLVMKHCPNAWVINYTNPMTLCTSAFYAAEPKIKAFGCCHEVFGTQRFLAHKLKEWGKGDNIDRRDIALDISGVNHFTFASEAKWKGFDILNKLSEWVKDDAIFSDRTKTSLQRKKKGEWFEADAMVALDFLRRFGALGAAGDRHLVEFVPWYLRSEKELHRWGVLCTPYSWRLERSRQKSSTTKYSKSILNPSGEEGVTQILALLGKARLDTNVNLPNRGQIANLPIGAIVETNAQFRHDSIIPIVAKPLPPGLSEAVRRIVSVQRMTLDAASTRSKNLAFEAILSDPLVCISTDKAWKMFNEMLSHTKKCLPGWKI